MSTEAEALARIIHATECGAEHESPYASDGDRAIADAILAAGYARGQVTPDREAKLIREFHGDDVWRDDQGGIWVRQNALIEAVEFNRRVAVDALPVRNTILEHLYTGLGACACGHQYAQGRPNHEAVSAHLAAAILALFNEKGNE